MILDSEISLHLLDTLDIQMHPMKEIEDRIERTRLIQDKNLELDLCPKWLLIAPSTGDPSLELDFFHVFTVIPMDGHSSLPNRSDDAIFRCRHTALREFIGDIFLTSDDRSNRVYVFFLCITFLCLFFRRSLLDRGQLSQNISIQLMHHRRWLTGEISELYEHIFTLLHVELMSSEIT